FLAPRRLPRSMHPLFNSHALAWLGVAIAAIAFAATWACWRKMGKSWRMGIDPNEHTQLIVTGPYAYVRHPIYALSSLLMLATVAIIPSPLILLVALAHLALLQWEARREEKHLLNQHGTTYAAYYTQVGRFIPRSLHPYQPGRPSTQSPTPK
ncbi:MAG: methyltransferase family protein, partial [Bacillota bacterium]